MKTVYDSKTGEPVTLNAIDANQRVACGLATEQPNKHTKNAPAPAAASSGSTEPETAAQIKAGNTIPQLKAELDSLEIGHDSAVTKDDYVALVVDGRAAKAAQAD